MLVEGYSFLLVCCVALLGTPQTYKDKLARHWLLTWAGKTHKYQQDPDDILLFSISPCVPSSKTPDSSHMASALVVKVPDNLDSHRSVEDYHIYLHTHSLSLEQTHSFEGCHVMMFALVFSDYLSNIKSLMFESLLQSFLSLTPKV